MNKDSDMEDVLAAERIPIVLGVTGHRDISDEDKEILGCRVREVFEELKDKYPKSPFILLSPLAEGADRLVAQVALDAGISLVVPLPMPVDEYEKDFLTPESKAEFRDLLNRATAWFELSPLEVNTNHHGSDMENRNLQYREVGLYVARHCQVLLALWDGLSTSSKAGTSHIVHCKLHGVPEKHAEALTSLDYPDRGQVYHFITRRSNKEGIPDSVHTVKKLFPDTADDTVDSEELHMRILDHINSFNRDVLKLAPALKEKVGKNIEYLMPPDNVDRLTLEERAILQAYGISDTLAGLFQVKGKRALLALLFFVVVGYAGFQFYLEFVRDPYLLLSYPFALALAFLIYFLSRKRNYQNKYLDYRALAEGLRVNLFWKIAGIKDDVASFYLRKQQGDLEWIRQALRNVSLVAGIQQYRQSHRGGSVDREEIKTSFGIIMENWVNDQARWFKKKALTNHALLKKRENLSSTFYWIGIGLAVATLVGHGYFLKSTMLHHVIIVCIAILLVLAATIAGYMEKAGYAEHFKEYNRMKHIFARAEDYLTEAINAGEVDKARAILRVLGKEALIENGDWVLLHRSRPIGVPKG